LRITITGTPGCGKTTVAEILSELLKIEKFNVSELVKEKRLYESFDEKRNSYVVDVEKLVKFFKDKDNFVAEGLVSHYIPADYCIVLRTEPKELERRLVKKGYSPEKIKENVEAEILGVIATEAFENPRAKRITQIDTTKRSPEEVAKAIAEFINGKEVFDEVDWLENETGSY